MEAVSHVGGRDQKVATALALHHFESHPGIVAKSWILQQEMPIRRLYQRPIVAAAQVHHRWHGHRGTWPALDHLHRQLQFLCGDGLEVEERETAFRRRLRFQEAWRDGSLEFHAYIAEGMSAAAE